MYNNGKTNDTSYQELLVEIQDSSESVSHGKNIASKTFQKMKKRHPLLAGICLGALIVLIIELCLLNPFGNGINLLALLLKTRSIETLVDEHYLYDADKSAMQEDMYLGMIYGLTDDDYAQYYTLDDFTQARRRTEGSFIGIGVNITEDPDGQGIYVVSVNADGPASEAGVLAGDIIIAIDGKSLEDITSADAVELIGGEEGTFVNLTILRNGDTLDVEVARRTIVTISVHTSVLTEEMTGRRKVKKADIGYISINTFNMQTDNEFAEALMSLLGDAEVAGIIIDLRNNGGGELTTCIDMMDMILKDSLTPTRYSSDPEEKDKTNIDSSMNTLLLQIENKNGTDVEFRAEDGGSIDVPIVVLVNERSASASEVFAGTLRDYGYKIIGNKTFGKGIVQTTYSLYDGTAVKFTTQQFRLAGGELIHGKGIEPDINVDFEPYDEYTVAETVNYANGAAETDMMKDAQLMAAVKELDEQIYEAYQLG